MRGCARECLEGRLSRIWPQGCWQSGPTPAPDAPAVWSRYRSPAVTDNASLQQRRQAAIPRGVATAMPIFAARAENAELWDADGRRHVDFAGGIAVLNRSEEHTSELQSLMRISYAVFCLKKKNTAIRTYTKS